uniref:Uncharacterized protein n=1 Tax=Arundo donax TaxID=35708 RepID=A0A0A9GDX9_ARUDO
MWVIKCRLKKLLVWEKGAIANELAPLQALNSLEPKVLKLIHGFSFLHFRVKCAR